MISDKPLAILCCRHSGGLLKVCSLPLKRDHDVVLAALTQDGAALEYAKAELRSDREIVLAAVKMDGMALGYAASQICADREIVLEAVFRDLPIYTTTRICDFRLSILPGRNPVPENIDLGGGV